MSESDSTRRTILHDLHVELGARLAPFGGFLMPIQYDGILKEHQAAREGAVLFDTCHMGELELRGLAAARDLDRLVSCEVAELPVGACRYGLMCNEQGGVVDDLVVARLDAEAFLVVVNAGTQDGDDAWIRERVSAATRVKNLSPGTAKIDLQGPRSPRILAGMLEDPIAGLRYYHWRWNRFQGSRVLVSRTGYTGEIGFEVYFHDLARAVDFWRTAMDRGARPAGLGARDTLRLEAGLSLYGHELTADRNAGDSGFTRALSVTKSFIGCERVREGGGSRRVGLAFEGRSAARHGDAVLDESGSEVGAVTSGSFAPSLGYAVAMAYVRRESAQTGRRVRVKTARQELAGTLVDMPFYRQGTARRALADYL